MRRRTAGGPSLSSACALVLGILVFRAPAARAEGGDAPVGETPETPRTSGTPEIAETPTPKPQGKPQTVVATRFDGGYATRRLFSLGVTGADLGLALGAEPASGGAFWGTPRVFVGSTENGLSVWSIRLGGEGEVVLDRFRFGGGVGFFVLGVHRAVRSETLHSFGPEARIDARFDVAKTDDVAFFVRGEIDAGFELAGSSVFWGPTIGAGVQLDVGGKRR